jgi:hypothetical protein
LLQRRTHLADDGPSNFVGHHEGALDVPLLAPTVPLLLPKPLLLNLLPSCKAAAAATATIAAPPLLLSRFLMAPVPSFVRHFLPNRHHKAFR